MNWDGIQYLDDARLYLAGDWNNAVNSQWSPLYVWVIAGFFRLFQPSPFWEFPIVHLANCCVAIFCLIAFQFFLTGLVRFAAPKLRIPVWPVIALAYGCFLYTTLDFTNLAIVSPDLLMHAFLYFSAGILVRMMPRFGSAALLFLLGITMGIGYLAKAPFFIYTFVILAIVILMALRNHGGYARIALALIGFLLVSVPYIAVLSHYKHRLTYGDSGRYNVVWMVNRVPYYHWQGRPAGNGTPLHPTHELLTDPPTYEFAHPVAGTYPPWYDPIYWNEGARPQYRVRQFAEAMLRGIVFYEYTIHHRQTGLVCGLLIALVMARKRPLLHALLSYSPLLLLGLFPFVMYDFIHQDHRFLTSFFVILWVCLFLAALQAIPESLSRAARAVVMVTAALILFEAVRAGAARDSVDGATDVQLTGNYAHPQFEIAKQLQTLGIQPGDQVAIVGNHLLYAWAHLADVKIIAETLMSDEGCASQGTQQTTRQWDRAKAALAGTGAKVVVSPCIRGVTDQPGWQQLGNTGVFGYKL